MLTPSSFCQIVFKIYTIYFIIIYLAIFHLWCVEQCICHLSLRISMPQNGSQHLYFIKTLYIQIQAPQNGYSAQELGKFLPFASCPETVPLTYTIGVH